MKPVLEVRPLPRVMLLAGQLANGLDGVFCVVQGAYAVADESAPLRHSVAVTWAGVLHVLLAGA